VLLSQGEANQELKRGKWSIGRRLKIGRKEEMSIEDIRTR